MLDYLWEVLKKRLPKMPLITKLDHDGGSLYLTGYLSILWAGEDSAIVAMKSLPQKMRYLK
jgi:hypothetical protein